MERAPRFERTSRLQAFELEGQRRRAGSRRGRLENRGAADMRADVRVGGSDIGRRDRCCRRQMRPLNAAWIFLGSAARIIA